jgi:undecaprenyl-diphosphatase
LESLLQEIIGLLIRVGPWIVFAVAAIETAAFVGLLIPAEATVLVAAFLADRGVFPIGEILAATFFGGLLGDQLGFLLGRYGGVRVFHRGLPGRIWRRYEPAARRLFQRHAALGVTLARFISFIRTLMPWFAGMSEMTYRRFLAYDALGVAGWAAGSVALGVAAGESWKLVASALGTLGALVLALNVIAGVVAAVRHRHRALVEAGEGRGEEGPCSGSR